MNHRVLWGCVIISLVLLNLHKSILQIDEFSDVLVSTNESNTVQVTDHTIIAPRFIASEGLSQHGVTATRRMFPNESEIQFLNDDNRNHLIQPIAFEPWSVSLPCFPPDEDERDDRQQRRRKMNMRSKKRGLLFSKLYKTASSTGAGIHLRISRNVAIRQNNMTYDNGTAMTSCQADYAHFGRAGGRLYHHRDKSNSILWTIVRDPTQRAISEFFHFGVSRRRIDPNDLRKFQSYTGNFSPIKDYYLRMLYTDHFFRREKHDPIVAINAILQEYNFIGIAERMEESIVVLMMLWNLQLADILYLSTKRSGGYDDGRFHNTCFFIQPSVLSSDIKEYIESDEWLDHIQYDIAFHQAVNRSIELTIDRLGRDQYLTNLQKFRQAKRYAEQKCLPRTIFPCDTNGKRHHPNETDCLWGDSGCGMNCLDEVATELHLW